MRYCSTRGEAPVLGFDDVLLTGLAPDGGLYLPEVWPHFSAADLQDMAGLPYPELAARIMRPFVVGSAAAERFDLLVAEAYAGFEHAAVTPLRQLDERLWLLELFHGPTLAFKDVALQLLGLLFDVVLQARGQRLTIVGATSGDTGSAAIEACRDRAHVEVFMLHPKGRTSEVQRRQMTTVTAANIHNLAIEGSFDDCQDLVKALFNDRAFRAELPLSAVNSINWARVMAQIV
jgi:threonine synthase